MVWWSPELKPGFGPECGLQGHKPPRPCPSNRLPSSLGWSCSAAGLCRFVRWSWIWRFCSVSRPRPGLGWRRSLGLQFSPPLNSELLHPENQDQAPPQTLCVWGWGPEIHPCAGPGTTPARRRRQCPAKFRCRICLLRLEPHDATHKAACNVHYLGGTCDPRP